MKPYFLSMFLMFACIALAVGWWLDHEHQNQALSKRMDGRVFYERIDATLACIWASNHCAAELCQRHHKRRLGQCVSEAGKYQEAIDSVATGKQPAVRTANEALWMLGIKSSKGNTAEDAFQILLDLKPNDGSNFSPELHLDESEERDSLLKFLSAAIAYKSFETKLNGVGDDSDKLD